MSSTCRFLPRAPPRRCWRKPVSSASSTGTSRLCSRSSRERPRGDEVPREGRSN